MAPKTRRRSIPKSPSPGDRSPIRKKQKSVKKKEAKEEEIIKICGGYTPIKKLGEGAYGVTWKAKKGLRTFAVKITSPKSVAPGLPLYAHDIIKEIDLFTRLRHPNVMESTNQIYISGGQICYFMPLMGPTFKKICDDFIPNGDSPYSSMEWRYSAFKKMLCGLAYLHSNFVIHCDLKPENVMYNPSTGNVRIIDYGLAVIFGSSGKVKFDAPTVSVPWRPPELFAMEISQNQGNDNPYVRCPETYYFGPEVDVYGMGWIGMELLFGILPPAHDTPEQMLIQQVAMGCSPGPEFSLKYQGGFFGSSLPQNLLQKHLFVLSQDENRRGDLLDIFKPNPNYLYEVTKTSPDYYIRTLVRMITSPPLKRPTSQDLIEYFPVGLANDVCEKITISYPAFQAIEYNRYFIPEVRKVTTIWIARRIGKFSNEVGDDNTDSVILEAIDLFDRISMVIPPSKGISVEQNVKLNAAASVYLAVQLMTSWGVDFVGMSEEVGTGPVTFSARITEVIVKLRSRLFRPTLDQYSGLSPKEALAVLMDNLSPSEVTSVSSESEVDARYESGRDREESSSWTSWLSF